MLNKLKPSLLIWLFFAAIGVGFSVLLHTKFFLFNFLYIGTLVSLGLFLFSIGYKHGRRIVQFGVGLYMLVVLGVILKENMQLSGFFYFLFAGLFQAAVIHYLIAKIGGPLLFGRAWCSYACWTTMILDLLPFKTPHSHQRVPRLGLLRYAVFAGTLLFVSALFIRRVPGLEDIMYKTFIFGNILYYALGIGLAFRFKDNRAFCKYFCPIVTFLKPASYFSLLRVKWDKEKCLDCGKCRKICPMDVDMCDNRRNRANATECILCGECTKACPTKALRM